MHVLQHNGNILYGPAEYSVNMIKYTLINDLEMLETDIPVIPNKLTTQDEVVSIDALTSVLPVEMVYPAINSKIEQLSGPFWTIAPDGLKAIGTYAAAPKDLQAVKNELKVQVAANRYALETKDLELTVAGIPVIIEGSRENKTIFLLSFPLLPVTGTSVWKFPKSDNFVNVTKDDIGLVIQAMMVQTQGAFDWEGAKAAEIDACIDLASLDLVDINVPVV